jgi:PAS domain S-box-containing protein
MLDRVVSNASSSETARTQTEAEAENERLRNKVAALETVVAGLRAGSPASAGTLRDVRSSDAYHSAFFENSPNDLFVLDVRPDGRFVFEQVNPMVTKSTGYTREMLVGKTPEEALTPANSGRLTAKYRQCVETRQLVEYEVSGLAPIGEVVRRTVLVPIVDSTGAVRKILGASRPELPVLFITGYAEPNGLWDANAAGIVLQKPFKVGDLGARLTQIIRPQSNKDSSRS